MNVQELIDRLLQIEDMEKEVRLLSADQSNDIAGEVLDKDVVYIIGESV